MSMLNRLGLVDRGRAAQVLKGISNILSTHRVPMLVHPNFNTISVNCGRALATLPPNEPEESGYESRSTKEFNIRQDEKQQVQAFLDSLPTQGISVNVFPGNNLEAAEKRLRKKVNQEGIARKFREVKVYVQPSEKRRHEMEVGLYRVWKKKMNWKIRQVYESMNREQPE